MGRKKKVRRNWSLLAAAPPGPNVIIKTAVLQYGCRPQVLSNLRGQADLGSRWQICHGSLCGYVALK